jgi:hypothetical protein
MSAEEITLVSDEGARQDVPIRKLVKLSREPARMSQAIEGSHLLLPEGDRLMRVIVGATNDTSVEVQSHSALGKLTVPLECVLGLLLTPPTESEGFDQLWDRISSESRKSDMIWLTNGDLQSGGFLGLDDRIAKFQIEGNPVEIDRTGVVGIAFAQAALNYPRPKSDFLELTLSDGSRLGAVDAKVEKGQLSAKTRFDQSIRFPITDLVRIDPRTPALVYLSEREVDGQTYVSFFGPMRPFRRDRSIDGHRFQLGGHVYERGLGTQSRTLIAYRLKPGDRRFQALVGVDERAGPLGSVVFRVLVDREPRLTTAPLTAKDPPQAIDLDVSAAKSLVLITEFGERGDIRDYADWVEARIIR